MYEVKPWNDDIRKKLQQIMRDGVTYVDDVKITRSFGRRCPDLFDENNGFLDIGKIDKRNKSMIVKRPNVGIMSIPGSPTAPKRLKFRFYKIF